MLVSLYFNADCVDVLVVYQHGVWLTICHCNDLIIIILDYYSVEHRAITELQIPQVDALQDVCSGGVS